jgi:hypothetical protein
MRQQGLTGLILVLAFSALCSFTYVEKYFGASQCYEEGISAVPLPNGNYLISGGYNCSGNVSDWKGYLLLLNPAGDTIWSQRDLQATGRVKPTNDGSFVFIGGNTAGQAYDTIHISKASQTGNIVWSKKLFYGVCKNTVTDILPVSDGYIVSGFYATQSCINPVYDAFITKLDLNGDVVWKQTVEGTENEQLYVLKLLPDGSITALGWTNSDNDTHNTDYLLVKLTANGGLIWRKNIGNEYNNYGYGMEVTPQGDILMAGYTTNMELTKLDADGDVLWKKEYGLTGGSTYFKVSNTIDGGFAVLGTEMVNGQAQAVFMKINSRGQVFWKKSWNARLREFTEKSDGSFVLTGYAWYLPDVAVIMMDSTMLPAPITHAPQLEIPMSIEDQAAQQLLDSTGAVTYVNEDTKEAQEVKVYPNPAEEHLTISFSNPDGKSYRFEAYDMMGALVFYADDITGDKLDIQRGTLSMGMYTYKLSEGNNTFAGKFLFR